MEIYAITGYAEKRTTYRSTWPYHDFFHGDCGPVVNRYGERPYKPLPLIRNANLMPNVFFGGISMVVSEGIARDLGRFDSVDLAPCVWGGVYDLPTDEATVRSLIERFSAFTDEFGEWLNKQTKRPDPKRPLGSYYEVLAPRLESLSELFQCDTLLELPSVPYEKIPPIPTCAKLHELYPMIKRTPYYFCTQPVFQVIEPHVQDTELFRVRRFDLA